MQKLNIKIALANRLYPMNINPKEEKMIRLSASKIQKMLKTLKERYSVKDDQDLLAMCSLQMCVKIEKMKMDNIDNDQFQTNISPRQHWFFSGNGYFFPCSAT